MAVCNICGGTKFEPGPNGRRTPAGEPVRCSGCYSLERHRSLHQCLIRVPPALLAWRRAIQFAPDPSLDPAWFRSYEGSQYGGENNLDLQDINRPDGSYDFISLSSVLEFVPDDRRAFAELGRIGSPSCIIHCTFTPASTDASTHDFEKPHGTFGRYHLYGSDLTSRFDIDSHGLTTLVIVAADPVTRIEEPLHFFCKSRNDLATLRASLTN